jgi:hypothetical protein
MLKQTGWSIFAPTAALQISRKNHRKLQMDISKLVSRGPFPFFPNINA